MGTVRFRLLGPALFAVLGALAVAFVLNACGDDPPSELDAASSKQSGQQSASAQAATQTEASEQASAQTSGRRSESASEQASGQESEQESEQASERASEQPAQQSRRGPTDAVAELDIEVDSDSVWQEVFDTLTDSEQSCLRSELGAEQLEWALRQPVLDLSNPEQWQVAVFGCLAPDTARALFLSGFIGELQVDEDLEVSESELSCTREAIADLDAADLLASMMADSEDETMIAAFIAEFVSCVPDLFLTALLSDLGAELDGLSEDEASCLREWVEDLDWKALMVAEEDSEESESAFTDFLACVPILAAGESDVVDTTSVESLNLDEAVGLPVGQDSQGTLEDRNDRDLFVFEAEPGRLYRIDVTLDTLDDSILTLFDAEGSQLAYNDDLEDSLASRIVWNASAGGPHYVQVSGYGAGAYSLSLSVSDIVDDHPNSAAGATPVTVGEAIPGSIDYTDDIDYFAFEGEQGQLYQIDVSLGSLEDSILSLYDVYGQELAFNDDHADSLASRIYWEAPASGAYYVDVRGYGAGGGSYTVTIAAR
jgi:hypothetical protein